MNESKKLSIKSPTFSLEIIEKSKVNYTKEQWFLRCELSTYLENAGYDHHMPLDAFENMMDDIMRFLDNHKLMNELTKK